MQRMSGRAPRAPRAQSAPSAPNAPRAPRAQSASSASSLEIRLQALIAAEKAQLASIAMNAKGLSATARAQAASEHSIASIELLKLFTTQKISNSQISLTDEQYREIMKNFKKLISEEEFEYLKNDIDTKTSESLTRDYKKDQIYSNFLLLAFAFILPKLINENISPDIANHILIVLRGYTIKFAMLYYNLYLNTKNPMIKDLRDGKKLTLELLDKLFDSAGISSTSHTKSLFKMSSGLRSGLDTIKVSLDTIKVRLSTTGVFSNNSNLTNFYNDPKNRIRFIFFYLSIIIVLLYFVLQSAEIALPSKSRFTTIGGKKKTKSKITTKPKKKA